MWRHFAHAQFFFFLGACDQHNATLYCPDRGKGFCILLEQKEKSSYKL
ncbi:unnamed protein product [Staurois parvus]|uniref:Uncharacterized protein n=1 Tax=Staurois parvus TaxID=386267 RepID=A0ABN9AWN3_9NEOB|nr:unnamed protein product [Staurois parvus]